MVACTPRATSDSEWNVLMSGTATSSSTSLPLTFGLYLRCSRSLACLSSMACFCKIQDMLWQRYFEGSNHLIIWYKNSDKKRENCCRSNRYVLFARDRPPARSTWIYGTLFNHISRSLARTQTNPMPAQALIHPYWCRWCSKSCDKFAKYVIMPMWTRCLNSNRDVCVCALCKCGRNLNNYSARISTKPTQNTVICHMHRESESFQVSSICVCHFAARISFGCHCRRRKCAF